MFTHFVEKYYDELKKIALGVRVLSQDMVLKAKSGHAGLPLGAAEMGTFLYFACMNFNHKDLNWFDRDRFVLSAGHGSALQYSLMHFADFGLSLDDLKNFRQLNSVTPGHPEYGHTKGVELTTGPLGQGLASGVGIALAERMLAARLNQKQNEPINHYTYVIAGDGCMMEGVTSEASSFAGHLALSKLIVLYDSNNITIDGETDITFSENVGKRYEAYGWNVLEADGNDFMSLAIAMDKAHEFSALPNGQSGPTIIICKTIIGKGSPKWEGTSKAHGNPMSFEDVETSKKYLGVEDVSLFSVPEDCYSAAKMLLQFRTEKSLKSDHKIWNHFIESGKAVFKFSDEELKAAKGTMATRVASGKALALIAKKSPYIVGGSADLAGSNNTTLSNSSFVTATDFSGQNIHFGVREHAMGAICNGLTIHGGLRAYCATFAVFSDYMRPAIRMAAIMNLPTIFIFTHDSFAVGEDGPTHQPIEQHLALRCIPNVNVYRPADALETFLSWENALNHKLQPSILLLTRQNIDDLGMMNFDDVRGGIEYGAYVIQKEGSEHSSSEKNSKKVILFASGSEVNLALKARQILQKNNIFARVVSVPNLNALLKNSSVLEASCPRNAHLIGLEAGTAENFASIIGRDGAVFGINTFGLSAPYADLAEHFGFTAEKFAQFVLNTVQKNKVEYASSVKAGSKFAAYEIAQDHLM